MSAEGVRQRRIGWLYVGDDGIEWSANHPVRSGEMPDARLIRRASNAELLAALKDAWEAHGEAIQSEGRLRNLRDELRIRAVAAAAKARGILLYPTNAMLTDNANLNAAGQLAAADALLPITHDVLKPALTAETGGRNERS